MADCRPNGARRTQPGVETTQSALPWVQSTKQKPPLSLGEGEGEVGQTTSTDPEVVGPRARTRSNRCKSPPPVASAHSELFCTNGPYPSLLGLRRLLPLNPVRAERLSPQLINRNAYSQLCTRCFRLKKAAMRFPTAHALAPLSASIGSFPQRYNRMKTAQNTHSVPSIFLTHHSTGVISPFCSRRCSSRL